jgi:hypothetical protein
MHELCNPVVPLTVNFYNWIYQYIYDSETDLTLFAFGEISLNLRSQVNPENSRCWISHNWILIHEVPLHETKMVCGTV